MARKLPDSDKYSEKEALSLAIGSLGAVTATAGGEVTGNYFAIQAISDAEIDVVEYGTKSNGFAFTGGSIEIQPNDIIKISNGASYTTATVSDVIVTTGAWDTNDAAGYIVTSPISDLYDLAVGDDVTIIFNSDKSEDDDGSVAVTVNTDDSSSSTLYDETLKAGTVIYGNFLKVSVASGTVRLYKS